MKCELCGEEHDGSYGSGRFCSKHCRMVYIGKMAAQKQRENGTLAISLNKARNELKKKRLLEPNLQPNVNLQKGGKCKFCSKYCKNKNSLINHERCCKYNPNRAIINSHVIWKKGHSAWNKGLTKETSQLVAKQSRTIKRQYVSGQRSGSWLGKHHTEEQKHNISQKMKIHYKNSSRWRTQIEKRKSYAEQYFERIFLDAKQNYHVDRYFLDFAWPDKKIYVEVDGEQHYNDNKVIAHDITRINRLEKLGWKLLMRIRWSVFQKMSQIEKEQYVKNLNENIKSVLSDF